MRQQHQPQQPMDGKKYYRLPDYQNQTSAADTHFPQTVQKVTHTVSSKTDPLGMYTGYPVDPQDVPIQDADDL